MDKNNLIGKLAIWSFIGGTGMAIIVGLIQAILMPNLMTDYGLIAWVLALIGAIVGIMAFLGKGTITKEEVPAFLTAGIALLVMYGVFQNVTIKPAIGALLSSVSLTLAIFIAPAVGILAIKAIWDIGKNV